jgi:hypothetical protein
MYIIGSMFESSDSINEALVRLSALMDATDCAPVGLLVCGGSALNILGLIHRSTRDVDVICLAEDGDDEIRFMKAYAPPAPLPDLIDTVARDLDLPTTDRQGNDLPEDEKWLNFGPRRLLDFGLPDGIADRLTKKEYGPKLTAYLIGRHDQIFLKLYACLLSPRVAIHETDLIKLAASGDEMREAVTWLLSRNISGKLRTALRQVLYELGHEQLIHEFYQ